MALERIKVRGFKSIRKLDLELRPINVLIGANGSGKSNFLDVFPLTHAVRLGREGRYSAMRGGADRALHFGPKHTSEIRIELQLSGGVEYSVVLTATDADRLLKLEESLSDDEGREMDLLFPTDSRVIVATQSPTLVDYFEPEDVVVVDLVDGATEFTRLAPAELGAWLDDFSLGQLWEKNHFGGRPA